MAVPNDPFRLQIFKANFEGTVRADERKGLTIQTTQASTQIVAVVDDDHSVRRSLKRLLCAENFQVETFASAFAFLFEKSTDRFGCLVLDIRMPGMNGWELRERLIESGVKLPIVVISAHDTVENIDTSNMKDIVAMLEKPIESAALISAIRNAMN